MAMPWHFEPKRVLSTISDFYIQTIQKNVCNQVYMSMSHGLCWVFNNELHPGAVQPLILPAFHPGLKVTLKRSRRNAISIKAEQYQYQNSDHRDFVLADAHPNMGIIPPMPLTGIKRPAHLLDYSGHNKNKIFYQYPLRVEQDDCRPPSPKRARLMARRRF